MPRPRRYIVTNYPHHVTHRGNNKQHLFLSDSDYQKYCYFFEEAKLQNNLEVLSYCLMPNHVHFIAVPRSDGALQKTMHAANSKYGTWFNKKYGLLDHVWQERYNCCVLDNLHLYTAVRYTEMNPVKAGLVRKPENWKWSSAGVNMKTGSSLIRVRSPRYLLNIEGFWIDYLQTPVSLQDIEILEQHIRTGRPCGESGFIQKIESALGITLKKSKPGRPKKG